jgi:hypothetical protein
LHDSIGELENEIQTSRASPHNGKIIPRRKIMSKSRTPLQYIQQTLEMKPSEFMSEWKDLSDKDKADLKDWAKEEMGVLGIPVKS